MTSSEAVAGVKAFVASYQAAFEQLDAAAISDHFAYPAHVTSDPGEPSDIQLVSVVTRHEWAGQIERLLAMYRVIGVRSAHARPIATVELSPRLVQSAIHWELRDAAGESLYDFEATYTLARIDGAMRITALSHNELPRYRACLAGRSRTA